MPVFNKQRARYCRRCRKTTIFINTCEACPSMLGELLKILILTPLTLGLYLPFGAGTLLFGDNIERCENCRCRPNGKL